MQIIGKIEAFYQGKPLVEVETLGTHTTQDLEKNPLPNTTVTSKGLYIAKAGLYF